MNRAITLLAVALYFFTTPIASSQTGVIKGRVYNSLNNESIPLANVILQGTNIAVQTNIDGLYEIKNLNPNLYNVEVSYIGFEKKIIYEVQVTNAKPTIVDIALEEKNEKIEEVEITASPFNKTQESPVSLRTLGTSEIERNPGGNRDISKVIQSLPGVSSPPSFRNDIIIRGGAPNENRFYLDGIEVPNINHFATQGSSGGPAGMINVNFIREVDFYSGSFPANRGNTLSSVFEFKQIDGNNEKQRFKGTIGATDIGLTADGPIGKKTTYIFSVRRSYLQFLFKALELPFLPTYNDIQFKIKNKINDKNEISIIGLGAIDDFILNLDANKTESQQYFLANLPVNTQWNYAIGANYKHFREKSYTVLVLSRNELNNNTIKYFNNDESNPDNLILDYNSRETENKLRYEEVYRNKGYKITYGVGFENVLYTNSTYNKLSLPYGVVIIDFNSRLSFNKYNLFTQVSKGYFNEKIIASIGLRSDANDYSNKMNNPIEQISPRFSLTYNINELFSLNFNTGKYFQLPAYTVLGYRDTANTLINKNNGVTFIGCEQIIGGVEYRNSQSLKITVEGFYKKYTNYPFLINDSISLANLGADFGVIGNAPVTSTSNGKAYGLEFMAQQKLYKGFYGILAYTIVRSEFTDKTNSYKPSAWDNRHIINITAGKKFKKNWETGIKWRFLGGAPYTPTDVYRSSLKEVWDITNQGLPDYSKLNSERLPNIHQLDVRVDKKYFLKKISLDFYIDIQNIYNYKATLPPYLNVEKDANGAPVTDPSNPNAYKTYYIKNESGTLLPSIGVIAEF